MSTRSPLPASRRPVLRRAAAVVVVAGALAAGALSAAVPSVAAPTAGSAPSLNGFRAGAWGTSVTVDGVYTAGRSAFTALGCTTVVGQRNQNAVVSAQVPGLFRAGAVSSTVSTAAAPGGGVAVTARNEVAGVSLLGGLVNVGTLTSQSTTTRRADGSVTTSDAGTGLASLSVGGVPVLDLRVNLRIALPGVGYLVVDEQLPNPGGGQQVNLLHLRVDATDTDVIIGHTNSGFGPESGQLGGSGYAAAADVAGVVRIGQVSAWGLPCTGTNGRVRSNTLSTLTLPGLGSAGVATVSALGTVDPTRGLASGRVQSSVAAVQLGSFLSASLVTADAQADRADGVTRFTDRSNFGGLTVLGRTFTADVPANTTLTPVPGVTLYLHRTIVRGDRAEVRMIELVVGEGANALGLPPLLDLRIGVASVRASDV